MVAFRKLRSKSSCRNNHADTFTATKRCHSMEETAVISNEESGNCDLGPINQAKTYLPIVIWVTVHHLLSRSEVEEASDKFKTNIFVPHLVKCRLTLADSLDQNFSKEHYESSNQSKGLPIPDKCAQKFTSSEKTSSRLSGGGVDLRGVSWDIARTN